MNITLGRSGLIAVLLTATVGLAATPSWAQEILNPLPEGPVGNSHIQAERVPAGCRILALQSEVQGWTPNTLRTALDYLKVDYTLLSASAPYQPGVLTDAINAVDLNAYDVVLVGWAGNEPWYASPAIEINNALTGRKAEIADWVSSGGGIVALSDWASLQPYSYLPLPVTMQQRYGISGNMVTIIDRGSPWVAGLSDDLLSGWNMSYHNILSGLDPAYSVVVRASEWWLSDPYFKLKTTPVLATAPFGAGTIAVTTMDPDWHYAVTDKTGAGMLLDSMLGAACDAQPTLKVTIDILPGDPENTLRDDEPESVPVAVLSSDWFDATGVDPESLGLAGARLGLLGHTEAEDCETADSNGDGLADLICAFEIEGDDLRPGQSMAVVEGETVDGLLIRGEDRLYLDDIDGEEDGEEDGGT